MAEIHGYVLKWVRVGAQVLVLDVPLVLFFAQERGMEDPRRTSIQTRGRLQFCRQILLKHSL
jgi:hypothetical protein